MRPYYEDEAVQIYHGDCRDILPALPQVDLVITDPPYVGFNGKTPIHYIGGAGKRYKRCAAVGDLWNADYDWIPLALAKAKLGFIVFCSYHSLAEIPARVGLKPLLLATWHKRNAPPALPNTPRYSTEFIWVFALDSGLDWHNLVSLYDIPQLATGCMASDERFTDGNGTALHPTQKPLRLMAELLKVGGQTIVDPFCGTGTTLRAAKDAGRKAIGIDREERFCELAAKRMAQIALPMEEVGEAPEESVALPLF